MLKELHLRDVGPAPAFDLELAERLNLFTGDNGLGKSFILDIAWWTLTGTWAGAPAIPLRGASARPQITFSIAGDAGPAEKPNVGAFDFQAQTWRRPDVRPPMPGIILYARVDGSFSVWDPARNYWRRRLRALEGPPDRPLLYDFSAYDLWNGLSEDGYVLSNGLIRDWVSWQNQPNKTATSPFQLLRRVLTSLSHPEETMRAGKPARVLIQDVRDVPTLELPYGTVPVTLASAGMRRVLALGYLLVWAWHEHVQASQLANEIPMRRLILLVDEVESHLHPRWQRTILPAILSVARGLRKDLAIQVLATTHSPLVLASVEPVFNEERDRCFKFELRNGSVTLDEYPWAKQGDAVGWLTSELFGLQQARSREAEAAIEAAEAFMRGDTAALPVSLRSQTQIQKELERVLGGHDPFWPRWIVTAERTAHG